MKKERSTIILGQWCIHLYNPINHLGNKWHYTIFRRIKNVWTPVADSEPEVTHKIGWSAYTRALGAAIRHLNNIRGIV